MASAFNNDLHPMRRSTGFDEEDSMTGLGQAGRDDGAGRARAHHHEIEFGVVTGHVAGEPLVPETLAVVDDGYVAQYHDGKDVEQDKVQHHRQRPHGHDGTRPCLMLSSPQAPRSLLSPPLDLGSGWVRAGVSFEPARILTGLDCQERLRGQIHGLEVESS